MGEATSGSLYPRLRMSLRSCELLAACARQFRYVLGRRAWISVGWAERSDTRQFRFVHVRSVSLRSTHPCWSSLVVARRLLNYRIGSKQESFGKREADALRGFQIYHEFEFRRLLDR